MSSKNEHIEVLLRRAGSDPQIIEAVKRLDAVMQHWRRRITKRELGRRAIEKLGLPVEQGQLDVLFAIAAPGHSLDPEPATETMVATIAERLSIDPSRASRMVAEMVEAGYARRAVSQSDARRTIVELTEKGEAIVEAVQSYKWLLMADYFSSWPQEDLTVFVPLLERFADWFGDVDASETRLSDRIAEIARSVEGPSRSGSESG